jgi:4-alpha-glucanotransferase
MSRDSGVLMHLSSLPSNYGIGTMGKVAYQFADFLAASGFKYWQLLPICPPSVGNSPYSAYSSFAGNPYFIDLDQLKEKGLLQAKDYQLIEWSKQEDKVDYEALKKYRMPILRKAALKYLDQKEEDYYRFQEDNGYWLEDYAYFMALKQSHRFKPWNQWPKDLRGHKEIELSDKEKKE